MKILQTAERVSHNDLSDNYVFQRSLLAYVEASKIVSGNVLEIGTGSGYGIDIISPFADRFVTIDKYESDISHSKKNVRQEIAPEISLNMMFRLEVPNLQALVSAG